MEKAIREQYNKRIFNELIEKYGVQRNFIEPLGGFENFVYQYRKEDQEFIIRISHTGLRRTKEQLHAEADFINYLAEHGISVARPVASPMGNLVETADIENPSFSAVSFEKAKGRTPEREDWTHSFCQSYGRLMGRIHCLTKDYQPSNPLYRRPDGFADLNGFAEKFLPSSESAIITKWNELLLYLKTLPAGRNEYGLIHQDMHEGNFFVDDNGKITVFDFDDCQYFWFAHDLAMALFYVVPHHCVAGDDLKNAEQFFANFMAGYREENDLDDPWILEIPTFMKLREMDLYIAIHRSMDLNNLDRWCAGFMKGRKEKILNDIPYIDLNFSLFI